MLRSPLVRFSSADRSNLLVEGAMTISQLSCSSNFAGVKDKARAARLMLGTAFHGYEAKATNICALEQLERR